MGEKLSEGLNVSAVIAETIEQEAARRGVTPDRFLRQLLSRQGGQGSPPSPSAGAGGSGPSPMAVFTEQMKTMGEMMPMLMMSKWMGGGPMMGMPGADPASTPVTRRELEDLLEEGPRRRRRRDDEDDDDLSPMSMMREIRTMKREKMRWSMMAKAMGSDSEEGQAASRYADDLQRRIDKLEDSNKAEAEKNRDRLEAEREERHRSELAARDGTLQAQAQEIATIRAQLMNPPTGGRPGGFEDFAQTVKGLRTAQEALAELRSTLAPQQQAPTGNSAMDKVGFMIDKLAGGIKEGLQGAGALAAGQRGISPELLGTVPPPPMTENLAPPPGYPMGGPMMAPSGGAAPPPPPPVSNVAAALGGGEAPPGASAPPASAPVAPTGPMFTDANGQIISKEQWDRLNAQGLG